MAARPVPLVPRKPVAREARVHLVADPVSGDLGHDRCGGDGRRDGVAIDDRPLRVRRLADGQGVDEQVVRRLGEVGQRLAHGELGGLQDVDPVDDLHLDTADTECVGASHDLLVQRLPPAAWEDLAVPKATDPRTCGQDDSRRDDRTGQGSASDLVQAGNPAKAGPTQLVLVGEVRVAGSMDGAAASGAGGGPGAHRINAWGDARGEWLPCQRGCGGSTAGRGGRHRDGRPRSCLREGHAPGTCARRPRRC